MPDEGRHRLARGHFVEEQAVREGIFRARPASLDEAVRAALHTEGFLKIEEQRSGKRPKFARVVDGDVQNPLKEIRKDVGDNQREVRQWLEKMTAQIESLKKDGKRQETCSAFDRRKAGADDVCFRCKRRGHFARDCASPEKRKKPGNGSQLTPRPGGKLEADNGQEGQMTVEATSSN